MNHAPPRPAPFRPVAHPVPVPHQAPAAAVERVPNFSVPVSNLRPAPQATAIRQSRPTWGQPAPPPSTASTRPPAIRMIPVSRRITPPAPPVIRATPARQTVAPPSPIRPSARGKVRLVNGLAVAPPDAPSVVRRAVAAGNRLQKLPYKWGGGHAQLNDSGYDCSGTVSYVLREAGLLKGQMTSRGFLTYGDAGKGDWITVWSKNGHVFMLIGDLRLDTGGSTRRTGPRWKPEKRSFSGFQPRHPRGY